MITKFSPSSISQAPRAELARPRSTLASAPVVVALDGAAASENAIPLAVALAKQWNAPVNLVQARSLLPIPADSDAYLRKTAGDLQAEGIQVTSDLLSAGAVEDALRSHCEKARLLVMARTKRSTLSRFCLGSVTDRLVGRLSKPLLLVPVTGDRALEAQIVRHGFARILAYLDEGASAENVIENAIAVAPEKATCHLLSVLKLASLHRTGGGGFAPSFEVRANAMAEMSCASGRLEMAGVRTGAQRVFASQSRGASIIRDAKAVGAQLIVVAARSSILPWWLRDEVADYVVRHSEIPVLIVPADKC